MQKIIIVTGGSGFIGSSLVNALEKEGHVVFNLDKVKDSLHNSICIDLANKDNTLDVFSSINPDIVFHLAASTDVRTEDVFLDFQNNVSATINILEACRMNNVQRFIFTSSAAVYGENNNLPIKESENSNPVSSYGLSKKVAEDYINYYNKNYGLPVSVLRLSNVFGINTKNILQSKGVIANFLLSIYNDKGIVVFGDGRQTRDFIYINDVVALLNSFITGPIGTFNLCSNTETSINELLQIIKKLVKVDLNVKYLPGKDNDILRSTLSNSKLKSVLNWTPQHSLDDGIIEMIELIKRSRLNYAAK